MSRETISQPTGREGLGVQALQQAEHTLAVETPRPSIPYIEELQFDNQQSEEDWYPLVLSRNGVRSAMIGMDNGSVYLFCHSQEEPRSLLVVMGQDGTTQLYATVLNNQEFLDAVHEQDRVNHFHFLLDQLDLQEETDSNTQSFLEATLEAFYARDPKTVGEPLAVSPDYAAVISERLTTLVEEALDDAERRGTGGAGYDEEEESFPIDFQADTKLQALSELLALHAEQGALLEADVTVEEDYDYSDRLLSSFGVDFEEDIEEGDVEGEPEDDATWLLGDHDEVRGRLLIEQRLAEVPVRELLVAVAEEIEAITETADMFDTIGADANPTRFQGYIFNEPNLMEFNPLSLLYNISTRPEAIESIVLQEAQWDENSALEVIVSTRIAEVKLIATADGSLIAQDLVDQTIQPLVLEQAATRHAFRNLLRVMDQQLTIYEGQGTEQQITTVERLKDLINQYRETEYPVEDTL